MATLVKKCLSFLFPLFLFLLRGPDFLGSDVAIMRCYRQQPGQNIQEVHDLDPVFPVHVLTYFFSDSSIY